MRISSYSGSLSGKVSSYQKLGQQEAAKHRPATDALHPDTHEVALRSEAEGLVANEQRLFDTALGDADKAVLDVQSKLTELKADIEQALADNTLSGRVDAALSDDRGILVASAAERIRREVAWRSFRAENGISEPAHYPESLIWHWAVILALALIETVANAFFYENSNGLVGGLMVALSVAAVNMGSATGLGSLFRRKNLAAMDQKILGWASFAIFIPLTLFCNALFAAFRSAYQTLTDPQDLEQLRHGFAVAQSEAARIFVFDFHFKDLSSFLLFMTGIGLSLLAFWKGYTSDDPFPGYSKRDRALKAAKQNDDRARSLVKQKIKDLLHSHLLLVQRLSSETGTLVATVTRRIADTGIAKSSLLANTTSIERDYHLVLDGYRQANLAIRGTPPPAYFADMPDILRGVSADGEQARSEQLKELLGNLEALQAQHRDALNNKINELQLHASQTLSSMFDGFINEVERDAEEAVQRDIQIMPVAGRG